MTLNLYNSLSKQKEQFIPLNKNNVGMYVCGPTVYDRAHVGNARAVVVFDVLYRVLKQHYAKVTYVRNITDVDDKINKAAKQANIDITALTVKTTKMFHDDMAALNALAPDIEPRATKHIPAIIKMIKQLIANNHAYEAEGHVLFDVNSDPDYGHLSRRTKKEMIAGARVEVAPYKKNPGDFVLWKPSSNDEPGWRSPWGFGRPGWHIECSAMSTEYLGPDFDIHGGGADLQFPHHENEIAQSCMANQGSKFAKYWVHNGFLTVEGEKMSKSLGNFITVHDLLDEGINGEVIRLVLMLTHYRKPLDFSKKNLNDARKALDSFYRIFNEDEFKSGKINQAVIDALNDDLNTPLAIAILHEIASNYNKASNKADKEKYAGELLASGQLLGLFYNKFDEWFGNGELDAKVAELIEQRKNARINKDWALSDKIRNELDAMGIILEDKSDGTTTWKRKL